MTHLVAEMKIQIFNGKSSYLPYPELTTAFQAFDFTENSYIGEGKIKRHISGANKYAVVKIQMQKKPNTLEPNAFVWDVSEEKIPVEFLDVILSTIKNIAFNSVQEKNILMNSTFEYRIIGGAHHPVDSSALSFEIATFMAMANIMGFTHEKTNSYLK
jgi:hypothetical protein